jgi:Zn-dependent protease
MENFEETLPGMNNEESSGPDNDVFIYPPKFEKQEQPTNVWLKSMISLALYLVIGYYIFHSFEMLLLITGIVLFHELGHFFAMKLFRYKDLGIFFIPLLGAYVSGTKREVSQKESAIILLAGPLPGIILGIVFYLLYKNNPDLSIAGISFYTLSLSLIILNLVNLLPIYPLDGGQLLNRVFLDEESWVSKIFIFISIAALCWFALFGFPKPFYALLIFPALMIFRLFGDSQLNTVEKKLETANINLDTSYDELPDEDYWKIRNILIEQHPAFKEVETAPPYEFDTKEEKIMTTIQSLLHRSLIQDLSIAGKLLILIICITAFASPWLLDMDMSFLRRLGF